MIKQYFIGIDGGGSKTDAVLLDSEGVMIAEKKLVPSAISGSPEPAPIEILKSLFHELCGSVEIPEKEISHCAIGLNGIDFADEYQNQFDMIAGVMPATRLLDSVLEQLRLSSDQFSQCYYRNQFPISNKMNIRIFPVMVFDLWREGDEGAAYLVERTIEDYVALLGAMNGKAGVKNVAVVEIVCSIDAKGANPLGVGDIPPVIRGIIQAVKTYETLTVEAAVKKELNLVYQALLNHPLAGDWDLIVPLVNEMMRAHRLKYR